MDFLSKDLRNLTSADIQQMCLDMAAEGLTLELKADLPSRDGIGKDPWHDGKQFSEYARNSIAVEIVAFANTFGGAVVIGIIETKEKPSRAKSPNPLPRVHDLERSLRQALQDTIDPPLPVLESIGIAFDDDGNGVVVIRVPASRRKPHRVNANREAYIRRMDESVKIGMRQIQELTIQSLAEARRIEDAIESMRSEFRQRLNDRLRVNWPEKPQGAGLQFIAVPTSPIDLGRVTGRNGLVGMDGQFVGFNDKGAEYPMYWPFAPAGWTPGLRRITASRGEDNSDTRCEYSLTTQAVGELAFFVSFAGEMSGLFADWLTGALGKMLLWIDSIRTEANALGVEFALAPQIVVEGAEAQLALYGARSFRVYADDKIPIGVAEFPIMSIAGQDEFPMHLVRFDEDLWNLVGKDFHKNPMKFELAVPKT
jgi:hypothetical protein